MTEGELAATEAAGAGHPASLRVKTHSTTVTVGGVTARKIVGYVPLARPSRSEP
jgi:hypothetical protein